MSSVVHDELRRAYRMRQLYNQKIALRGEWYNAPAPYVTKPVSSPADASDSFEQLSHLDAMTMCNKLTFLYWYPFAHGDEAIGLRGCTKAVCAAVWHRWIHIPTVHKINFGFYFARVFRMTQAPSFADLLRWHEKLCDKAEQAMTTNQRIRNYKILPLCRAVVTVLDQQVSEEELSVMQTVTRVPGIHPPFMEAIGNLQNVLMIRTEKESALSAPIDFSSIAHHAMSITLPDDETQHTVSVPNISWHTTSIRVPLNIAIDFLSDIQAREQRAFPGFYVHLVNDSDATKNPALRIITPGPYANSRYCPSTEEEFVQEVCKEGLYLDAGANGPWVRGAIGRVRNRSMGVQNWNDLEKVTEWDSSWPRPQN
jgi:hypothetical protein